MRRDRTSHNSRHNSRHNYSGREIEQLARAWLRQQGLRAIEENYRCRVGEIDLVMEENGVLVFVEVRYRKYTQFGDGAESVDWRKRQKLIRAAQHYLVARRRHHTGPCRFDVVAATQAEVATGTLQWRWIKDAFGY